MKPLRSASGRKEKKKINEPPKKEGLPWQTIITNSNQNLVEGIEFVLLPGLPHDCVTFTPPGSAYPRQSPPFVQPKPPLDLIYVADFWLHSLHKHLTAATAPILFLINRSSAALSCRTNNSPRSSGDIFSAQGAFSPSLLSRRTTTLGGDGDPEIIDKFSSPTKRATTSLGKEPWLWKTENALSFSNPGIDCGYGKNPQG